VAGKFDVEAEFLPMLCERDTAMAIFESGVRGYFFADDEIGAIVDWALDYFVRSGYQDVVSKALIAEDYPVLVDRRWADDHHHVSEVLSRLREKYFRSRAEDLLLEAGKELPSRNKDPLDIIREVGVEAQRLVVESAPRERAVVYGEEYMGRLDQYQREVIEKGFRPRGIHFGWETIDDHINGLLPGEVAVFASRLNVGKSWGVAKIAIEAAKHGHRVYLASLENNRRLTLMRCDCLISGVPYKPYERGQLGEEEQQRLKEAEETATLIGGNLLVDMPSKRSDRTLFELYSRARAHGAELFIGDQLTWVSDQYPEARDRFDRMGLLFGDVGDYTKEMGMASVWAHQINREGSSSRMTKRRQRPSVENLADSDVIGQNADWVFILSGTIEQMADHVRVLDLQKPRRSEPKAWTLDWELSEETRIEVRGVFDDKEDGLKQPVPDQEFPETSLAVPLHQEATTPSLANFGEFGETEYT
jgi:replicative DNA helicase